MLKVFKVIEAGCLIKTTEDKDQLNMRLKLKPIAYIFILFLIPAISPGQSRELEKAAKAEQKNDLMSAIQYYKDALAVDTEDTTIQYISYRIA
ncbi:MAG: hypothetical protein K9G47_11125, partial [Bacteroidales bacterium]|nr:hypothetical protein [Bacteroidales bacterium]